jgi:hypothetical protein
MPIKFEDESSKRKDTGRTDKYSDETPKKDYEDYRSDYPKADETARKISKDITDGKIKPRFIGGKSIEVRIQELTSHIQNYQETFNNQQRKAWKNKLSDLMVQLEA